MRGLLAVFAVLILVGCTDRTQSPIVPSALDIGEPFTLFTVSSREQEADGGYGYDRASSLHLLEMTVSIPPTHTPGNLKFGYANPDPETEFTLAEQKEFTNTDSFLASVKRDMRTKPSQLNEIVLFVHGYNSTQTESVFRAAQLASDLALPSTMMTYSWPSQGKLLGYAYDIESMLFARDGLEKTMRNLRAAGVKKILLVGHSMGSALIMETLRQIEIRDAGWAKRSLSGVALISPDLDTELFRTQLMRIENVPEPFVVLVSGKDVVLSLSAWLRGDRQRERLGNITDINQVSDLPIQVIDTTAFSKTAASGHFVAATSPALIAVFNQAQTLSDSLGEERIIRDRLLPGSTVVQSDRATELILAPENPG